MKRPALCIGIPYVLGLTVGALVTGAVRLPLLGCLLIPGMAVLIWRRELWKYVLLSTLSCLTACCVYWHADSVAAKQMQYANRETAFTGTVTETVRYTGGYARYTLRGTFPDGTGARVGYLTRDALFAYGDTLTLAGTPEDFRSTYLYDAAASERADKVFLQFGWDTKVTSYVPLQSPTLRSVIRTWRETMIRRIRARMGEETGVLLTGLLFGEKAGLSRGNRTALYRAGIGHVLVISGLHFDFLALLADWMIQKLRIWRKTGFAVMCVLGILLVICAGETVSVQRACIMLLIRQSGRVFFRKADNLNSLSIAMLVLGLENPFVVHSLSFWLSFTATFGIAVLAPYMTQKLPQETLWQTVFTDVCACCWCFLAVLPVCVICFREVSLVSPLTNTLLVPVCLGSMLLGVLALPFGCRGEIAGFLLDGADVMNGWILGISRRIASLSWTHAPTGSQVLLWAVLSGTILTALVILLSKNRKAATFTTLCAVLVTMVSVQAERISHRGELRLAALGETNSTLLVLTDGTDAVLLDFTGQTHLSAYAEAYLTGEGISHISAIFLCKPSARSVRSYAERLTFYPPDAVWLLQDKPCPPLLDASPQYADGTDSQYYGAQIRADRHGAEITYAGMTCVFTEAPASRSDAPEVLYCTGKAPAEYPDCGILFVPADAAFPQDAHTYSTADCAELTITESGTCRVRRLYGEN